MSDIIRLNLKPLEKFEQLLEANQAYLRKGIIEQEAERQKNAKALEPDTQSDS